MASRNHCAGWMPARFANAGVPSEEVARVRITPH
jgi:hypothetical protein